RRPRRRRVTRRLGGWSWWARCSGRGKGRVSRPPSTLNGKAAGPPEPRGASAGNRPGDGAARAGAAPRPAAEAGTGHAREGREEEPGDGQAEKEVVPMARSSKPNLGVLVSGELSLKGFLAREGRAHGIHLALGAPHPRLGRARRSGSPRDHRRPGPH